MVGIAYESGLFVGEVADKQEDVYTIRFMEKCGKDYRWEDEKTCVVHANFSLAITPLLEPRDASLRLFRLTNDLAMKNAFDAYKIKYFDV